MSFHDPKHASRAFIAIGGAILGVSARFASTSSGPFWVIAMYVGFVFLVRGIWLGWKYRRR